MSKQELSRINSAIKILKSMKEENKKVTKHLKHKEPKKWMDGAMMDLAYSEGIKALEEKLKKIST